MKNLQCACFSGCTFNLLTFVEYLFAVKHQNPGFFFSFFFILFYLFIGLAERNVKTCETRYLLLHVGTMQMLDARHIELFLSEGFHDGSWEYELIGTHKIEKNVRGASAAIFDVKHLKDFQSTGNFSIATPI